MRIETHPILKFSRGEKFTFYLNDHQIEAYEGETIAAALYAAEIWQISTSIKEKRSRGVFCINGNCSSCLMTVNGEPNIRVCVTEAKPDMKVEVQQGRGEVHYD